LNDALVTPEVRNGLATLQSEPVGGSPEEFGKRIVNHAEQWRRIIKEANITLE
jgi:tripartite-type tricarboxylate transporter receptor subunit TctC